MIKKFKHMNPQAEALNQVIKGKNEVVFDLLSERGKNIFLPQKGHFRTNCRCQRHKD